MQYVPRICAIVLTAVFLLSVMSVEPDCVQGYRARGLPVFVEKDAACALCETLTLGCDYLLCVTPVTCAEPARPESSLQIAGIPYRGPPSLSTPL